MFTLVDWPIGLQLRQLWYTWDREVRELGKIGGTNTESKEKARTAYSLLHITKDGGNSRGCEREQMFIKNNMEAEVGEERKKLEREHLLGNPSQAFQPHSLI